MTTDELMALADEMVKAKLTKEFANWCGSVEKCRYWGDRYEIARTALRSALEERILQALSDNGQWIEETARLRAERDAAVKDAGRYRWLLSEAVNSAGVDDGVVLVSPFHGEDWQEQTSDTIDAAMAQTKETP